MIVNSETVSLAFKGFQKVFTDAHMAAPSVYAQLAMTVASSSREETYGWMGAFPNMREWLGP